jgi:hypothetical protein
VLKIFNGPLFTPTKAVGTGTSSSARAALRRFPGCHPGSKFLLPHPFNQGVLAIIKCSQEFFSVDCLTGDLNIKLTLQPFQVIRPSLHHHRPFIQMLSTIVSPT